MSRILNRPMFRGGGKVSSYGKGIASGLTSKPKRGLVDEPGGYAGKISMSTIPADIYNKIFNKGVTTGSTGSTGTTGASVVQAAKDKVKTGTSKTKNLFNKSKSFLKSPKFSEAGIMEALKKYGPKVVDKGRGLALSGIKRFPAVSFGLAGEYVTRPQDVDKVIYEQEGYGPIEGRLRQIFDPTYTSKMMKVYEQGYDKDGKLKALLKEQTDSPTGIEGPPGGGDPNMKYTKPKVEEPKELTMKEQVAKDKALFAELLGEGEARGKDVSDMLLRFAGSGGNTVGEKFQQYIGAEAMAGPSRTEKINQAAASLAINDYIAGKRSKENMEMMLEKTKFGVDYTLDAQKAAKDISNMDFQEALSFYSENVLKGKKGRMDPQVIKGVLTIQMPGQQINTKTFSKKSKNEVAVLDATEFFEGINIVTYKGGKMLVERVGDIVTEVPNLFIT